jgi:membrane protein DedA with SNARE-associated domain
MTDWSSGIIKSIGNPAIAALMFVENAFPPLPSKLIMPFAGYMVAIHRRIFVRGCSYC